jgi:hypothetical protein
MPAKKSRWIRAGEWVSALVLLGCGSMDHNLGDSSGSGGGAGAGSAATSAGGASTSGTASSGAGGTPTSGTASGGSGGSAGNAGASGGGQSGGAGAPADAGGDGAIPDCPSEGCYGTTCDIARLNMCNSWKCPGLTDLCPTIRFVPGDSGTNLLENPDALTCALQMLRDGTPGILNETSGQGAFHAELTRILLPNRKALTEAYRTTDAFASGNTSGANPIQPREYFASCLLDPSEKARVDCWNHALTGCR